MPLYEYDCSECGKVTSLFRIVSKRDDPVVHCEKLSKRKLVYKLSKDWFRAHWNEHFETPVYVESKKHYKRLCKENGVQARCLM